MNNNLIGNDYLGFLDNLKKRVAASRYKYMRKFAEEYPDFEFVQQLVAQLPWSHIVFLMGLVSDRQIRQFYMAQAVEQGWSPI